jgi:hypothetical protein
VPRRQQRRPTYRPPKSRRVADPEDTGALDAGARRFLNVHGRDVARLEAIVRDLRQIKDEADKLAFEEPSPDALREYRRATRELAEAERALGMVEPA